MKKSALLSLFALTVLLATAVIYFQSVSPRQAYEKMLLSKARSLPQTKTNGNQEEKAADQPDMAAFQEYIMTLNPATGQVPKKELYQTMLAVERQQTERTSDAYVPPIEWQGTDAMMGGRTRMIMYDPNDSDHKKVWAGGVTGGLWYTYDIANTDEWWQPVDDFWANLSISSMTYDPNNTETFYVGTGEAQTARIIYRESSGVGVGIFTSQDAGETWELLASTVDFDYITDIVVRDEGGSSVIYAAVVSGVYHGVDFQSEPSDGLYRSTDSGDSWEQVLPDINGSDQPYAPSDIEIGPSGRIFVGTMENLNGEGGATILYSDSGLPGSWQVYDEYNTRISNDGQYNIPARTIVAVSQSDPDRVYAQFAGGYADGFIYYRGRYMVRSDDGGQTWDEINPPASDWSTLAWHAFILQVDPLYPNIVYTGGLDLWRSANGGSTWTKISDWIKMYYGGGDDYVHADQHNIQFEPGSYQRAIFSSDGGIFLTNTANYSSPIFIQRNQGYNTLQFYTCAINPISGVEEYIGGLQDNGTLKYSGSPLSIFSMIDGGDGAYCFWDEDAANVYITSVYYNSYSTWRNGNQVSYFGGNSGTFISPADYNSLTNTLYANATDFFGGYANTILRATGIPVDISYGLINVGTNSQVAFSSVRNSKFSPFGTTNLFVGTQSGLLYKILNANDQPEAVEIGSPDFPMGNISCIAQSNGEDTLLVTFSNYGVSSVWLTYNGGETWMEKETNLPDMPIRWAMFHPENTGQVMLATELGIWVTNTLLEPNTQWVQGNEGMGNVRVDMLTLREADNTVLAASHGRGLFTTTYEKDVYTSIADRNREILTLSVYPNPAVNIITIERTDASLEAVVDIMDMAGHKIISLHMEKGQLTTRTSVDNLNSGLYMIQLNTRSGKGSVRLNVQ